MSFTPDKIFCVVTQLEDGRLWGVGGPWGEGQQIHDASRPAVIDIPYGLVPTAEQLRQLQDTLKCAGVTGEVTINVLGNLVGCLEDCIDATRSKGRILINVTGEIIPTGKHVVIVKGESDGVTIRGKLRGHGSQIDVELGGYYGGGSLPNLNGKTVNTTLDLTSSEPISIRQFRATAPKIANTQAYEHDKMYELIYPVWLWFRERGIGK